VWIVLPATVNASRLNGMPVAGDGEHVRRDERRRRTESGILAAARELFAETGFERTTIRAVAASSGVDPALVMQYYGSKEGLFAEAARWGDESQSVLRASREDVPGAALHDLFERLEGDGSDREAAVALLRNCLTHPEAARITREQVMCDRIAGVARTLGGADAELRAGLIGACLMGLTMSRYLLEIEPVASSSREDVERLLAPALRALVDPPAGR